MAYRNGGLWKVADEVIWGLGNWLIPGALTLECSTAMGAFLFSFLSFFALETYQAFIHLQRPHSYYFEKNWHFKAKFLIFPEFCLISAPKIQINLVNICSQKPTFKPKISVPVLLLKTCAAHRPTYTKKIFESPLVIDRFIIMFVRGLEWVNGFMKGMISESREDEAMRHKIIMLRNVCPSQWL